MTYFAGKPPYGSMLKDKAPKAKPAKVGKDTQHLEFIRGCPCLNCGLDARCDAAHVRMAQNGKPEPGMGAKPHDRYTVPLCHQCHMDQHKVGEREFWGSRDPLKIAAALYLASGDQEQMRAIIYAARAVELMTREKPL